MKNLITVFLTFSLIACALGAGGKSVKRELNRERKHQDKLWRPCQDFEVKESEDRNPVGKFCSKRCTKRTSQLGKCKAWEITVKDFNKPEDFHFFRSSSFILIDEDSL